MFCNCKRCIIYGSGGRSMDREENQGIFRGDWYLYKNKNDLRYLSI